MQNIVKYFNTFLNTLWGIISRIIFYCSNIFKIFFNGVVCPGTYVLGPYPNNLKYFITLKDIFFSKNFIPLSIFFIICFSQTFFVCDEEFLVAVSFFAFVYFAYSFMSESVNQGFVEDTNKIKENFVAFKTLYKTNINKQMDFYIEQTKIEKILTFKYHYLLNKFYFLNIMKIMLYLILIIIKI